MNKKFFRFSILALLCLITYFKEGNMTSSQNISIEKTIKYIESSLNETMNIEKLAKVAGYSPYHFSRIFKQATGENIATMIKRLRLAQSVKQLLNLKMPVTDVGLETGYETPSSFNKVFKQTFGCSPSEYRRMRKENLQKAREKLEGIPEIITMEEKQILCVREHGEYGEAAYKAWEKMLTYMYDNHHAFLLSDEAERFGICYDLPDITQMHLMRYEACVIVHQTPEKLPEGFYMRNIPEGRYAKYRYQGSYDNLYEVSPRFYGWVQERDETLTHFPLLEKYCDDINLVIQQQVTNPVTELHLQLQ